MGVRGKQVVRGHGLRLKDAWPSRLECQQYATWQAAQGLALVGDIVGTAERLRHVTPHGIHHTWHGDMPCLPKKLWRRGCSGKLPGEPYVP